MSEASNPRLVKVSGPAIEKPVKTFEPTYLLVDCSAAGPGRSLYLFVYGDQIVNVGGYLQIWGGILSMLMHCKVNVCHRLWNLFHQLRGKLVSSSVESVIVFIMAS